MNDDTSSKQPIRGLKNVMSEDVGEHPSGQLSPESLEWQQKQDFEIKKSVTTNVVRLIWLYALSALVFVVLDGLKIDEFFELSDWLLGVYIVAALSPTSAYFLRKLFTLSMHA